MRHRVAATLAAWRDHWVVLLGVAGVVLLIWAVDPVKVARAISDADPRYLLAMLPVVVILYLVHGAAWWVALRGAGAQVGLRRSVKITIISQAFDVLPGGDLWRVPVIVTESDGGLDAGLAAATVIYDDLVYFFVLTLAMVPAAVAAPEFRIWLAAAMLPQATIFVLLLTPTLYNPLAARVSRFGPIRRFAPELEVLGPAFRHLVRPQVLAPVVVLDAVCAVLAIGLYWLAVSAVHASGVGVQQVAFTYASGQVLSGLAVIPAALGAYEGMMTGMLALQGVAPAAAAASAIVYRAINDLLMGLVGLVTALFFSPHYLKRAHQRATPVPR